MSNFLPAPQPGKTTGIINLPYTTNVATTPKSNTNVAFEIADFFFGIREFKRMQKEGATWGEAALWGVNAALFFIPQAKLAKLSKPVLDKVIVSARRVMDSKEATVAAKRAAEKTYREAGNILLSSRQMEKSGELASGQTLADYMKANPIKKTTSSTQEVVQSEASKTLQEIKVARAAGDEAKVARLQKVLKEEQTAAAPAWREDIPFSETEAGKYFQEEDLAKKTRLDELKAKRDAIIEKKGKDKVPSGLTNRIDQLQRELYNATGSEKLAGRLTRKQESQMTQEEAKMFTEVQEQYPEPKPGTRFSLPEEVAADTIDVYNPVTQQLEEIPFWKARDSLTLDDRLASAIPRTAGKLTFKERNIVLLQARYVQLERILKSTDVSSDARKVFLKEKEDIFEELKIRSRAIAPDRRMFMKLLGDEIRLRVDAAKAVSPKRYKRNISETTIQGAGLTYNDLQNHIKQLQKLYKDPNIKKADLDLNREIAKEQAKLARLVKSGSSSEIKAVENIILDLKSKRSQLGRHIADVESLAKRLKVDISRAAKTGPEFPVKQSVKELATEPTKQVNITAHNASGDIYSTKFTDEDGNVYTLGQLKTLMLKNRDTDFNVIEIGKQLAANGEEALQEFLWSRLPGITLTFSKKAKVAESEVSNIVKSETELNKLTPKNQAIKDNISVLSEEKLDKSHFGGPDATDAKRVSGTYDAPDGTKYHLLIEMWKNKNGLWESFVQSAKNPNVVADATMELKQRVLYPGAPIDEFMSVESAFSRQQRNGLATAMLIFAKEHLPLEIAHGPRLSEAGSRFVESTLDIAPKYQEAAQKYIDRLTK